MIEILTNPWVIIIVVLSVVIGNIAALKYTAKMKFSQMDKSRKNDLDKLNTLDKQRYAEEDKNKNEPR
ncbi:DUF2897 family protein [Vibrio alginolyticus]|uniref:DUF2897 family protein n=1 Tax=Vibrio TaxID=662 RepID=UPI001CDBD060|nr:MULTISPECIES: DUF2897 family protein [Vibrio]EIP0118559.1 DUF2897 family protein [Vibrio alginolyticus]ELB2812050.1 DUF2897 family protein [Vibrio alginolyticus]MCA2439099.1 DUF2897 family protein [Vibrio alginolyticus]MCS0299109.1 DUF2897 family protein [Vibrio alginolyticus]MDW1728888.1 DUF2897 family protein [Vibrio sp. Vb2356]